jgi:GntR family transcriptional regulator
MIAHPCALYRRASFSCPTRLLTMHLPPETSVAPDATAPLDSGAGPAFSPLYQQIKNLILQSLQIGEWKPGEAIPSEMDLAARFRVSQGTVRKAIDELAAENLLLRRQGKGTFVATHTERQVQYRFLRLQPDVGDIQSEGPATREIIAFKRLRASAPVARLLGLPTADPVFQVRRVLAFNQVPTICEDLWLPAGAFKGLSLEQLAEHSGPMYGLFESAFGVRLVRAEEKIKAINPDPQAAELLGIDASAPVLSVERIAYTYNNQPMELRRGLYRTDTHHYRNELS